MDKDARNVMIGLMTSFILWFVTFIVYDFEWYWSILSVIAIEASFWGLRYWWKERSSNNDIYVD